MNMSLRELYVWLTTYDFPSLAAVWGWLVSVPWWLAVGTLMLGVFVFRTVWGLSFYFVNWLSDSTFKAGERFGQWLDITKRRLHAILALGRMVRDRMTR